MAVKFDDIVAFGCSDGTEVEQGPHLPSLYFFVMEPENEEESLVFRFYHSNFETIRCVDEELGKLVNFYDQNALDSDELWSGSEQEELDGDEFNDGEMDFEFNEPQDNVID
ncbi:hypothetical protein RF11_16074 [Thelohanellus kitauei]|uniref:Uncharacterized protein n=1 Tax=Thelohanellus kitauei TaxID=669202 RepID=A0A0C2MMU6_THEKT|nr:hypothetical protein RF11_16074 [Thelohanellus kitauei]